MRICLTPFSAAVFAPNRPGIQRTGRVRWLGLLLLSTLGLLPNRAGATHIVGGQMGMSYVSRGVYDLTFTLYFDVAHGNPGAFDSVATVVTYERGRGRAGTLDTIALPLVSRVQVPYTSPGCRSSVLNTDEVHYARRVYLDPDRYASQAGYYMVWQRASRNYVITNLGYILPGSNPPVPGQDVGQTFFLEFPALLTPTGADFVNSSPTGFTPLRDYACTGRPFRYPFGGTDPDGDSLVYELVSPLQYVLDSLQNNFTIPVPGPGPYPPIVWAAGFDSTHQITGPVPLRVNRFTGELTFTSQQPGLYVFAVRVREYRAGRLLGELRREFQELVLTCRINQVPNLMLTAPAPPNSGTVLTSGQLITLPTAGEPGERCLNVYVTDPDSTTRLNLRVVPVDPLPSLPLFSITNGLVNRNGRRDSLYSRLCFSDCFSTDNIPLRFWVIADDQGCHRAAAGARTGRSGGVDDALADSLPGHLHRARRRDPQRRCNGLQRRWPIRDGAGDQLERGGPDCRTRPTGNARDGRRHGHGARHVAHRLHHAARNVPAAAARHHARRGLHGGRRHRHYPATFDAAPPNVITPNADNLNDRFAPHLSRSGAANDCEPGGFRLMRIFNRWGKEVFRTTDERAGWNGGDAGPGTYFYLLEYTNRENVKGLVELIR